MLFVVRSFPEITIKTRQVRRRMIRVLRRSLRTRLTALDQVISAVGEWDNLGIRTELSDPVILERIRTLLAHTPGIASVLQVRKCPLPDLDGILELARACYAVKVEELAAPESGVVIIDIRHPEEEEACPLLLPAELRATVEKIPFYELRTRFSELPHGPQYLLYCDRGIMSRLPASHLRDAGLEQVAAYRPPQAAA